MMNYACSNTNNEEDQDEDHHRVIRERETATASSKLLPFSVSSSSSVSASSPKYRTLVPPPPHHHHQQQQQQNSWLLGPFDSHESSASAPAAAAAPNFDVSLGNNNNSNNNNNEEQQPPAAPPAIEKEHMFDKVVTPSDVGKLNRLVIPKQHAERYFPLDSSSNEKGLLLNFEDRNGKAWRFRYSYWNSSQSYVMTKGWSRFVKEKKLDAGDIVSFQRGVGELGKDRLYIDWRRRPDHGVVPDPTSLAQMQLQNQLRFQQSIRWGTRLYSSSASSLLPQSLSNYDHLQRMNYNNSIHHHHHPYYQQQHHHHHQYQQHQQEIIGYGNGPIPVQYYLRPSSVSSSSQHIHHQIEGGQMPMVIDSVPVVVPGRMISAGSTMTTTNSSGSNTAAKRLRLFGVNMECQAQDHHDGHQSPAAASSSDSPSQTTAAEYSNKGKSSLSFDLDL